MNIVTQVKFLFIDIAHWMYWVPLRMIVRLMPMTTVYMIAKTVSYFLYIFYGKKIRRICDKLRSYNNFWHKDQVKKITLGSLENYTKRQFENLVMGKLTMKHLEKMVMIEGLEHLNNVLKDGKGAIIQLSHFGSFLLILPALGFLGYIINQLAGKPEVESQRTIYKWIYKLRKKDYESLPINFINVDHSIRPVINALKRNELVAMALDGRDGDNWVTVPFMGQSANFFTGSLRIASLTGAQILPTFIIRQPDDTHTLIIGKSFVLEQYGNKQEFLLKNMERLAGIFEKYISKYPDHFLMTIKTLKDKQEKGMCAVPFFNNLGESI